MVPKFFVSKSRLEALFDAVFSIAMTLMVLEVRIPELENRLSVREFATAMHHNIPAILAFLISMFVLGIFWYRHHRQYHYIARVTPAMLAINLAFLCGVAFFPFSAGVIGNYPMNFGVYFVYIPNIALLVSLLALQWYWARRFDLLAPDLEPESARLIHLGNILGMAIVLFLTVICLGTILAIIHFGLSKDVLIIAICLAFPPVIILRIWKRRLYLRSVKG